MVAGISTFTEVSHWAACVAGACAPIATIIVSVDHIVNRQVKVLVNGNLTKMTEALAERTAERDKLIDALPKGDISA